MRISELLTGHLLPEGQAGAERLLPEGMADPDDPRGVMLGAPVSGSTGSKPPAIATGRVPMPSLVVQPVTAAPAGPHAPTAVSPVDSSSPGGAVNTMDIPLQPARAGLPVARGKTASVTTEGRVAKGRTATA